jgi:hypothetical protein
MYMHVDQTVSKATVVLVCRGRREIWHSQDKEPCAGDTLGLSLSLQNRNCEPIDCASLNGRAHRLCVPNRGPNVQRGRLGVKKTKSVGHN